MKIKVVKLIGYDGGVKEFYNTKPSFISVKALTELSFELGISYAEGEEPASEVKYKIYYRKYGSKDPYVLANGNNKDQITKLKGNVLSIKGGIEEKFAGAEIAISFGVINPYIPPFKDRERNLFVGTVKYLNILSCDKGSPHIKSAVWSKEEMIQFGKLSPKISEICRDEDGYLHIESRGMFGQKVRVDILEKDNVSPIKYLLLGVKNDVQIWDNVAYVPIKMGEIYSVAKKYRWFEGDTYEIFARITPNDTSIPPFESELINLKMEKKPLGKTIQKSTVNGTQKFVIGKSADDEKKDCGGKYCITKANYKEKNASFLIQEINIRLAGFGGNVPTDKFDDKTEATIKQFQRDYMKVEETGKICGSLLRAIDEFCADPSFDFNFEQTRCSCLNSKNKAPKGYTACSGFGNGLKENLNKKNGVEYPGIHRSLLFILKATMFYLKLDMPSLSLSKIDSGYRCWADNMDGARHIGNKTRTSSNHMGCALDLHFNKNGKRTKSPDDIDDIRKNIFYKYMGVPGNKKNGKYYFGWSSNKIGLEPKKYEGGQSGARTWVHVDVRGFNAYKADMFFIKDKNQLSPKPLIQITKELKLSDMFNCKK